MFQLWKNVNLQLCMQCLLVPIRLSQNTPQRPYFEAKFSDGVKSTQVVSFKWKLRSEIEEAGALHCKNLENHNSSVKCI